MQENKGETFLSPEIAKLSEKLQKDPSSKLFFPLAEEYIKCSMMDEAIMVLTDGLKIHPGFHAARVSLGKVYLQKGRVAEAKAEFEKVVAKNPDNLMAQKKLALIYRDEGNIEKAKRICEAILLIDAKDAEMKRLMMELDKLPNKPPAATVSQTPSIEPATSQAISEVASQVAANPPPEIIDQPDLQNGVRPVKPQAPVTPAQDNQSPEDLHHEERTPSEQSPHPLQADAGESRRAIIKDQSSTRVPACRSGREESPQLAGGVFKLDEAAEGLDEDIFSELLGASTVESQGPTGQGSVPSQTAVPAFVQEEEGPVSEGDLATMSIAELYIKQGHYEQGIEIYRKILEQDPDNAEVRQRLEDTLALANLLTKRPKETRPLRETVKMQDPPTNVRKAPTPDRPIRPSPEQLRQAKVLRLQAWLEQLKRSQNP